MNIFESAKAPPRECVGLTFRQIETALSPEAATTLRHLTHILKAPHDTPRLPTVIQSALRSVQSYGMKLIAPTNTFNLVQQMLEKLNEEVSALSGYIQEEHQLEQPLLRRLQPYAPYALVLNLASLQSDDKSEYQEAAGVEIALRLVSGQCFHCGFATAVRRALMPHLFEASKGVPTQVADWHKIYQKTLIKAEKYFEGSGNTDPDETTSPRLFDTAARHELSRKARFAPPRQRQALLDRRHQTIWQLKESAAALMDAAERYDQTALLTLVAFFSGLTLQLTMHLPLADRITGNNWLMLLDIEAGVIKTCIDTVFPKAAQAGADTQCFRPASKIIVKPLPGFLWVCLRALRSKHPDSETLAQLLSDARTSGRELTLPDDPSALSPSTKRFLIAAGPLAVSLGIDRLSAALLSNDFAVVPASKLYYCRVRRTEIWAASEILFGALGWGIPAPIVEGLPVGSRIVPTRSAATYWWHWMAAEVIALAPGRHCSPQRLFEYHNSYARLCASFCVFCLAGREVKTLKFTTHNLRAEASFASFVDKLVGIFPGELKVPINKLLRTQLRLWMRHCEAMQRRLKNMSNTTRTDAITHMLDGFLNGECHALFFKIELGTCLPVPLGTADLVNWWPNSHRFSGDLGRHFWEVELRDAGVRSSRIDTLLRHVTLGVETQCSTNWDRLSNVAAEITAAQERILDLLEIHPVSGLVSKIQQEK